MSSNVKIHFAGAEQFPTYITGVKISGVRYGLLTAFSFIAPCLGLKSVHFWRKSMNINDFEIPKSLSTYQNHVILDSGLFTLMFGSQSGKKSPEQIRVWFDNLCRFISENIPTNNFSCVEVDCQKVLSPKAAWDYRIEMRKQLPNHDIMNVWHIEDGMDGLKKLIEFSNYICISIPELRVHMKHCHLEPFVTSICKYIKHCKPEIRIHLLGCTQSNILLSCKDMAYSCDSTSWQQPFKFGGNNNVEKGISKLGRGEADEMTNKVKQLLLPEINPQLSSKGLISTAYRWGVSMLYFKKKYEALYGDQN